MTDYLTVAEVLAIHQDQIERYGGSHGVRDRGLLEAALYRPPDKGPGSRQPAPPKALAVISSKPQRIGKRNSMAPPSGCARAAGGLSISPTNGLVGASPVE